MALTTHPHLLLRLKKENSYTPTPTLGFMACSRVNFTFLTLPVIPLPTVTEGTTEIKKTITAGK
jgi:hypothetical protein